jgi:hypothetical protein
MTEMNFMQEAPESNFGRKQVECDKVAWNVALSLVSL